MHWTCQRCGARGVKQYETAAEARRYALAFDREDREEIGARAPLAGGLPLRVLRVVRRARVPR